jgi:hypothetical protein
MSKHTIYRKLLSKSSLTVYKKNVYCYKQIWRMQSREPCFAKFDRTNDFASKYQSIKVIIFLFLYFTFFFFWFLLYFLLLIYIYVLFSVFPLLCLLQCLFVCLFVLLFYFVFIPFFVFIYCLCYVTVLYQFFFESICSYGGPENKNKIKQQNK